MIKLLQKKFIRIAMVTLTVAMVLVVVTVNVANWISVRGELFNTLALVSFGPGTGMLPAPSGRRTGMASPRTFRAPRGSSGGTGRSAATGISST